MTTRYAYQRARTTARPFCESDCLSPRDDRQQIMRLFRAFPEATINREQVWTMLGIERAELALYELIMLKRLKYNPDFHVYALARPTSTTNNID